MGRRRSGPGGVGAGQSLPVEFRQIAIAIGEAGTMDADGGQFRRDLAVAQHRHMQPDIAALDAAHLGAGALDQRGEQAGAVGFARTGRQAGVERHFRGLVAPGSAGGIGDARHGGGGTDDMRGPGCRPDLSRRDGDAAGIVGVDPDADAAVVGHGGLGVEPVPDAPGLAGIERPDGDTALAGIGGAGQRTESAQTGGSDRGRAGERVFRDLGQSVAEATMPDADQRVDFTDRARGLPVDDQVVQFVDEGLRGRRGALGGQDGDPVLAVPGNGVGEADAGQGEAPDQRAAFQGEQFGVLAGDPGQHSDLAAAGSRHGDGFYPGWQARATNQAQAGRIGVGLDGPEMLAAFVAIAGGA